MYLQLYQKYIYGWNSKYISTIALNITHGIYEKAVMTFINLSAINMFNYYMTYTMLSRMYKADSKVDGLY